MGNLTKEEVKILSIAMTFQLGDLAQKALSGDLDSINIIADSFFKRKDFKNALKIYTISATRNHVHSQKKLGDMYNSSVGVPTDYEAAMLWYKKAYNNGCIPVGNIIAAMYFRGHGVPMDKKVTMEWLLKAANAGCSAAQYNAGFMYQMGFCTNKDIQLALQWYQKSANNGYEQSKMKLKDLNERGYYLITNEKDINSLENRLESIEKEIFESETEKDKLELECKKMSKKIERIKAMDKVLEDHRSKQNSNVLNAEIEIPKMLLQYIGSTDFMDDSDYYDIFSNT